MPSISRPLAAAAVAALLAVSATACGPSDDKADPKPSASVTSADGPKLPSVLPTSLGDLEKWKKAYKDGAWKNWDKDQWLRKASDFINPVIDGLWDNDRMKGAEQNDKKVPDDVAADKGKTDPVPAVNKARAVDAPYHENGAGDGKIFFDGPKGSMVCSGTVVQDPAHPGKSNLVWTAGHCVHAGGAGGWYRNVIFVPSYNDSGKTEAQLKGAKRDELAPLGVFWADGAATSDQWIANGAETGGKGSPYDFAVLHVAPDKASGTKSLEEKVGSALPVWFNAPSVTKMGSIGAWGYPAAPPFDGQRLFNCTGKAGRLSLFADQPTEYRLGCTMTGGSSGGGWYAKNPANNQVSLVSNTSIGPVTATWLAGPHLGAEAKAVYDKVSKQFK